MSHAKTSAYCRVTGNLQLRGHALYGVWIVSSEAPSTSREKLRFGSSNADENSCNVYQVNWVFRVGGILSSGSLAATAAIIDHCKPATRWQTSMVIERKCKWIPLSTLLLYMNIYQVKMNFLGKSVWVDAVDPDLSSPPGGSLILPAHCQRYHDESSRDSPDERMLHENVMQAFDIGRLLFIILPRRKQAQEGMLRDGEPLKQLPQGKWCSCLCARLVLLLNLAGGSADSATWLDLYSATSSVEIRFE